MRRTFICGNWKLHKGPQEAADFASALRERLSQLKAESVEVGVGPVFTSLAGVAKALAGSGIRVAAQNCAYAEQGALTGEVSPKMLLESGCDTVIVGHSERRQFFGESDETVNKRAHAALAAGLLPIICVGETLEERESGRTLEVVGGQVREALKGFAPEQVAGVVLAYEPVWAIGTGKVATPKQAQEVHADLRRVVAEVAGEDASAKIRIQYGGSVKPDNAAELLALPDVDGALVGGASLKVEDFAGIVEAAASLKK